MMRRWICLLFMALMVLPLFAQQKRCGWDQLYELNKGDAVWLQRINSLQYTGKGSSPLKSDVVYSIPVVFHVIYKNSTENVSDEQIQSQLDVLNQDYRKRNADTTNVDNGFSIADVRIEFCLARQDPDGNSTTGITRTMTDIDDVCIFTSTQFAEIAPAWDADQYLNIWVCDINDFVAGYAFPPGGVAKERDGVVIDFSNFGTMGSALFPYNGGRTATHEIGHWLDLLHPWGVFDDNRNCTNDDGIADTPLQSGPLFSCPISNNSCGSADMLSNYMGFLDDRCMGNFTGGQKVRMRDALLFGRAGLIDSDGCIPVGLDDLQMLNTLMVFPNPVHSILQLRIPEFFPAARLEYSFTDLTGKKLQLRRETSNQGLSFDASGVKSSIYLLELKLGSASIVKKIVVQH